MLPWAQPVGLMLHVGSASLRSSHSVGEPDGALGSSGRLSYSCPRVGIWAVPGLVRVVVHPEGQSGVRHSLVFPDLLLSGGWTQLPYFILRGAEGRTRPHVGQASAPPEPQPDPSFTL